MSINYLNYVLLYTMIAHKLILHNKEMRAFAWKTGFYLKVEPMN